MKSKVYTSPAVMFSPKIDDLTPRQFKMYYEMLCQADSDGFLTNIKMIRGITSKDIQKFIEVEAILEVDGEYVVVDWWVHNNKVKHNYRQGTHTEALQKLSLNQKGAYFKASEGEISLTSVCDQSLSKVKLSESNIREVSSTPPLPFNDPEETETVFKKDEKVFENYMYGKILEYARQNKIQTSEASIRKFIQYNDRKVFLDMDKWQRRFVGWAKQEKNPTAIVGSEHFEHLGG